MKRRVFVSLAVLTFATLACSFGAGEGGKAVGGDELQAEFDKLPAGDAARGEQIFLAQPCHACHMDLSVGPAFPGDPPLEVRADTRRPGYSAELYLYESIIEPNADIVPGFQKDIMPGDFSKTLTDQEMADLIAYLMTMK
jgi:mono/diheme cytochrome c family protein